MASISAILADEPRVEALGDVDVLVEPPEGLPQAGLLQVEGGVVAPQLVLAVVEGLDDGVEVGLGALVALEVVADLVAEGDDPEQLAGAGGALGVEVLDGAAQLDERRARPWSPARCRPRCIALTGVWSRRLDVSAAPRMSSSPMDRTSSALAVKAGELGAASSSDVTNPSTLAVEGRQRRLVERGDLGGLGGGDRLAAPRAR